MSLTRCPSATVLNTFAFKSVACIGDAGRIDHSRRQRRRGRRRTGRGGRHQQDILSVGKANSLDISNKDQLLN